jgi:hypothetical protein
LLPLLVAICSDMMKRFGFKFHGFPWFCWSCAGDDGLDLEKWQKLRRQAAALNTLTTHTYTPSAQALVRCLKLHSTSAEGDGTQVGSRQPRQLGNEPTSALHSGCHLCDHRT